MHEIVVLGSSHANAAYEAYSDLLLASEPGFRMAFFFVGMPRYTPWMTADPEGRATYSASLLEDVRGHIQQKSPRLFVSMIGGAEWVRFGIVAPPRPCDFVLPDEPDAALIEGSEIIPYDAVREIFLKSIRDAFSVMRAVGSFADLPCIHVSAPPPIGDTTSIEAYFAKAPGGGLGADVRQFGVAPRNVRYKFWRASVDVARQVCTELGIHFLPVPPGTQDQEGFLRREYWSDDVVHANDEYGRLILAQLRDLLPPPAGTQ